MPSFILKLPFDALSEVITSLKITYIPSYFSASKLYPPPEVNKSDNSSSIGAGRSVKLVSLISSTGIGVGEVIRIISVVVLNSNTLPVSVTICPTRTRSKKVFCPFSDVSS